MHVAADYYTLLAYIEEMVSLNIHIRLIELLDHEDNKIVHESLKAITSMTKADSIYASILVDQDCFNKIFPYLQSNIPDIRQQAYECLGNMVVSDEEFRVMAIEMGIIPIIVNQLHEPSTPIHMKMYVWAASMICLNPYNNTEIPFDQVCKFESCSSFLPLTHS